ncbi:MAG: DNA-protecting protein DprA [Acidobacteria bacterium]|nr:DNA-protecting protein DprA [Acidobacteriota bacterium]
MSQKETWMLQRLALLLGGLGRRERRAFAGVEGVEPFEVLRRRGLPGRVLRTAAEASKREAPALLKRLRGLGWRWVTPEDDEFPALLRELSDPPLGLFVRGRLPAGPAVAIVGSRKATVYGRQVADLLGREMAAAGVVVVSGMARGVDAAAHRGALGAGGPTVAVWGTGPDRVYPPEHVELAEEIAASGALVTEYPPGTPARRYHFPERNRIIAGMTAATVVVEAAARSGALVTARFALEEDREVFAVPGSILSPMSVGPNTLLSLGARPVLTPRTILDVVAPADAAGARLELDLGPWRGVLGPGEALSADEIAERAGRPIAEVLAKLLEGEIAGTIVRQADGRYALARVSGVAGGGL